MSETSIKRVSIADVVVPERLREVDDAVVAALSKSIETNGLLNPITIRATPNAKGGKWALVAGAHRLRSVAILGEEEIDTIVVKADELGAQILEIEENLWRNDLTKLDRAVFVQTYRDLWERKNGKIQRGGDQTAKLALCPSDMLLEAVGEGFTETCAERLGISARSVERAQFIAQNIPPVFRRKITGTALADNQSALLKLAKLEPDARAKLPAAWDAVDGDVDALFETVAPAPKKPSKAQAEMNALVGAWVRASKATKRAFVKDYGDDITELLQS